MSEPKLGTPSGFPFKQPKHSDVQSSKQINTVQGMWEGSVEQSWNCGLPFANKVPETQGKPWRFSEVKSSQSPSLANLEQR